MYNRSGFGVRKEYDKWYYKDPVTEETHGPFYTRDEASVIGRHLKRERTKDKTQ